MRVELGGCRLFFHVEGAKLRPAAPRHRPASMRYRSKFSSDWVARKPARRPDLFLRIPRRRPCASSGGYAALSIAGVPTTPRAMLAQSGILDLWLNFGAANERR